jgi:hypothetical protein
MGMPLDLEQMAVDEGAEERPESSGRHFGCRSQVSRTWARSSLYCSHGDHDDDRLARAVHFLSLPDRPLRD